jgi:hypothetical protein
MTFLTDLVGMSDLIWRRQEETEPFEVRRDLHLSDE